MKIERTKNSIRNVIWGLVNKIVALAGPFIVRTTIIHVLGSGYLGLSSLFTSILQVLSLAELGFASAIVFSMYEPIAKDDTDTICALMNLYKRIYRVIGCIVLVIGLAIIPFMDFLINKEPLIGMNVYILYGIYLFNSVISYFLFAYKNCLLSAHQRLDVVSNVNSAFNLAMYVLQVIILITAKNYYLYAILIPVTTILTNIANAYFATKIYPNYQCKGKLAKEKVNDIKRQVTGLMMNKICQVSRNSLDSIIISAFLGLTTVAIYNNYYYIISSLNGFMVILSNAILAGVGNSISVETQEKNYKDMSKFLFMYMWIVGWSTCCLACLYQPFMKLWVGEALMLENHNMFLFCLYYYCLQMGVIRGVYYDAAGLWWYGKFRAFSEALLNILLNIILGKLFGITGIICATLISLILVNYIYGSHLLFRYYFTDYKVLEYYKSNGYYMLVTLIGTVLTFFICLKVPWGNSVFTAMLWIVARVIICLVVPNVIYFIFYCKTEPYRKSKEWLQPIVHNTLKRLKSMLWSSYFKK